MENNNNTSSNDIAIIGMSGRFPMANDIEQFWDNIQKGKECITHYDETELINAGIESSLLKQNNYIRSKGEMSGLKYFDASFFNINPKDAELMDPQHRVLLEKAWQAFEHAGYNPECYDGSVGVYVGKSMSSYLYLNVYPHIKKVLAGGNLQAAIGNDKDSLATTISYHLNLKGPSIAVQSSSSTSLVGVCIACLSLLTYQCDMALAGGITAGPPIKGGYIYDVGGIMAKDGHNRSFDKDSSGFVPGNGCGLVVLKRLEDAIQDKDFVWAIIKGYHVNNDGYNKVSYTAPSSEAQAELIASAQAMAGISPDQIDYLEAHGTGTRLGDPIEIKGATKAFRYFSEKKNYCAVGSVKSNIGHLDSAAGIAGLIKATLALHHKQIPPSINFCKPNPAMDIEDSPFYINTNLKDWTGKDGCRYAGVTSLGMGGTNAHVVLQDAVINYNTGPIKDKHLITLSAKTPRSLASNAADLINVLKQRRFDIADIAYTLAVGRKHFGYRHAFSCRSIEEAISDLEQIQEAKLHPLTSQQRKLAFIFSSEKIKSEDLKCLYRSHASFRETFDHTARLIDSLANIEIRLSLQTEKIELENNLLKEQCLSFAVGYSLAQTLKELGVEPSLLIGHGSGEYIAATFGGVFSVEDIIKLIIKGTSYLQLPDEDVLVIANANEEETVKLLPGSLEVVAVNSPYATVVSVAKTKLLTLEGLMRGKNLKYQLLENSHFIPSSKRDALSQDLKGILAGVKIQESNFPIISSVTGDWMGNSDILSVDYWATSINKKINFVDCINKARENANYHFLEIGAGDVLTQLLKQMNQDNKKNITATSVSNRKNYNHNEYELFTNTLRLLYLDGIEIEWPKYYSNEKRKRVPLPTYNFEKTEYWIPSEFEAVVHKSEEHIRTEKPQPVKKSQVENRPEVSTDYVAPSSQTEKEICKIWEDLLSIYPVGVNDNFFDLDGHSLLATQLISRITDNFCIQLPMETIFDYQTVSELAAIVDEKQKSKSSPLHDLIFEIGKLSQEEVIQALNNNEKEEQV